jgi:hypothetical protein
MLSSVFVNMSDHPGIVFRSGAAGRRAGLVGGPDVWEVIRVFRDAMGDDAIARTSELCGLTPEQVQVAVRYYTQYQDEIDAWIRRVDEEADRAEAVWRHEHEQALHTHS